MTYLNLVNNVMKRLREAEVTTVTQNTYSTMMGEFVNDAKEFVEDAWDWSGLRKTITVTTSADDYTYTLTGSGIKDKLLDAINNTDNLRMVQDSRNKFNERYFISTAATGSPSSQVLMPALTVLLRFTLLLTVFTLYVLMLLGVRLN